MSEIKKSVKKSTSTTTTTTTTTPTPTKENVVVAAPKQKETKQATMDNESTRSVKKPKLTMTTLPEDIQEAIKERLPKVQEKIVRHNLEFQSTSEETNTKNATPSSSKHRPPYSNDNEKISDSELEL